MFIESTEYLVKECIRKGVRYSDRVLLAARDSTPEVLDVLSETFQNRRKMLIILGGSLVPVRKVEL